MKLTVSFLVAALVGVTAAHKQGGHGHAQFHKRQHARAVTPRAVDVPNNPSATAYVYELAGQTIDAQDVKQGLENGTLVLAAGEKDPFALHSVQQSSSTQPVTHAAPSSSVEPVNTPLALSSSSVPPSYSTPSPSSHDAPAPSSYNAPTPQSGNTGFLAGAGMDKDFPDGELSCSQFPDQYGALDLEWLGLGGWSGIQKGSMMTGGYGKIETVVAHECNGKDCCAEGAYCSYACPAGYQKSQWPQTQGNTGQSVGGIKCQGGKLHLTNKQMSSKLCIPGSSEVPIKVQNKMGESVAICRTDYPGTESETVPLDAQPGTTQNVTCPHQDKYYSWLGKPTSAQYYVNPKGKSVKEACQWSTPGSDMGNYAPLNIGVGYSAGRAWLSVFQNAPTTNSKLKYSVEIVGDSNNLSGKCRYKDGQYCSGDNYQDCSPTKGCTVSAGTGTATFVLSD